MTEAKIVPISEAKQKRVDRWVNQTNKFGSITDPIARTSFHRDCVIDRFVCDAMFRYDWVTRRAVEIPAKDTTREWIDLKHDDPKRVQAAEDELERLDARGKFQEAILLGRLYGGNTMILGAFDGRPPDQPLTIPKRPTLFIANVDRYLAYPQTFYQDPMDPNYGEIETYLVNRPHVYGSDVQRVHESRIIRFDGNYLPPLERIRNFTYGASIIENVFEAVRQFGVANQSGSGILEDFITKKLKIADLATLISNEEGESMLLKRLGIMASEMSINNLALYGEGEELEKMGTPVSGLPDLMNIFIDIVSAAVEIPKSRFFHNQTGRLGGDAGANDLRNHYDNMAAYQENVLRAKMKRFLDIVLAPLGFEPGEMGFEWSPLWQLSEKELSENRYSIAQSDEIYIRNGVVEPEEVAMSRFSEDGINLNDMQIATKPREDFIKQLEKGEVAPSGPVDLSEPNPQPKDQPEPKNPDDDPEDNPKGKQGDLLADLE